MSTVYILKLEHDKYYVGSTDNIEVRINAHSSGGGALWTKLHKPIRVVEVIRGCDEFDEDKYVKKYMHRYGIDNVRGGSYVFEKLDAATKKFLEREMLHSSRACFKCGKLGHFVKECPTRTAPEAQANSVEENLLDFQHDEETHSNAEPPSFVSPPVLRPAAASVPFLAQLMSCDKCKTTGHTAESCLVSPYCNVRVINTPPLIGDETVALIRGQPHTSIELTKSRSELFQEKTSNPIHSTNEGSAVDDETIQTASISPGTSTSTPSEEGCLVM